MASYRMNLTGDGIGVAAKLKDEVQGSLWLHPFCTGCSPLCSKYLEIMSQKVFEFQQKIQVQSVKSQKVFGAIGFEDIGTGAGSNLWNRATGPGKGTLEMQPYDDELGPESGWERCWQVVGGFCFVIGVPPVIIQFERWDFPWHKPTIFG